MKVPIRLMQNKLHAKLLEHLKLAGSAQPSELTQLYSEYKQSVSNALSDLHKAGLVKYTSHSSFPPKKVYEITDYGWNATNAFNRLTQQDIQILQGKTYMEILRLLPMTPTDIATALQVTVSDISHHLRILRKHHLVDFTRKGKFKMYHITHRGDMLRKQNREIC